MIAGRIRRRDFECHGPHLREYVAELEEEQERAAPDLEALRSLPAAPLPTAIVLPLDSVVPNDRECGTADGEKHRPWQEPYASRLLELQGDGDRAAWFHFCHGHHVEFIYWQVTRLACERVTAALQIGGEADADRWLTRVAALTRGSGAMLYFCGALDAETYDRCLRPSMEAERDDFSGDMSRDFLAMVTAKAEMEAALKAAGDQGLIDRFRRAERVWWEHHRDVVDALHPGRSLLREKVDRLQHESESFDYRAYLDNVVRSDQALSDYDDYFGVRRTSSMTLDAYWTQALEKLATVHSDFAIDPIRREELMHGDAAVLAVLSELVESD